MILILCEKVKILKKILRESETVQNPFHHETFQKVSMQIQEQISINHDRRRNESNKKPFNDTQ